MKLRHVYFAIAYFQPKAPLSSLDKFWTKLQNLTDHGTLPCFIIGDLNARLGELSNDITTNPPRSTTVFNWLSQPNWSLLSPDSGRWTTDTASGRGIPDHIIVSSSACS